MNFCQSTFSISNQKKIRVRIEDVIHQWVVEGTSVSKDNFGFQKNNFFRNQISATWSRLGGNEMANRL